jgi:hypothetical protein
VSSNNFSVCSSPFAAHLAYEGVSAVEKELDWLEMADGTPRQ